MTDQQSPFGCVNNTIRLRSGRYFDLAAPHPDQFEFSDIAGALSKICRFGGQIESFYSVAEHSYHCWRIAYEDGCSKDVQLAVLLHDAAEAFIGDMVKPLKVMMPEYREVEASVELAVAIKFNAKFGEHAAKIREIDHAMLIAERRSLFSKDEVEWTGEKQVRVVTPRIQRWRPESAEEYFSSAAWSLGVS